MKSKGVSESRRVEEARNRWHRHMVAQRASGQNQVAYCRAQGLDPTYFSMWKRKLAAPVAVARSMRLVPLVVKAVPRAAECAPSAAEPISMHVKLRNGLSVSLRVPSLKSIPVLLSELAELPC